MGQWYDIGLQAGKIVAEKVDEFIKNEQNFNPKRRKRLRDGSVVYQWYMKWNPYLFKDEQRFCDLLETFDDLGTWISDEQYKNMAYKLVCVGDEGGNEELGNEAGNELFDCLYDACEVTFPDEFWEEESETEITNESVLCGFVFCHGDKDFSCWEVNLSKHVRKRIEEILRNYCLEGTSERNVWDSKFSDVFSEKY